MRERILNDIKEAMKAQDKELLNVIRMVKGAMQLEEINLKRELNDDEVISVIQKQIKTRKESIEEFNKANRTDLVEKTLSEVKILEKYMPEQLPAEEINKIIDEAFDLIKPLSMKDMGKIMSEINPKIKGKADMSYVSSTIKEKLNNM